MRHAALCLTIVVAALGSSGCGPAFHAKRGFLLDVPWEDYQRIVVRTRNGGVELSVEQGDDMRIEGELRARGYTQAEADEILERLTIVAEPDAADPTTFLVELEYPDELRRRSVGARLNIRIPQPCAADITTNNGRIVARGLKGEIELHTSNGRIIAQEIVGGVRARSSNGRIHLRDVAGPVNARTSNGPILAEAIGGDCDLKTSNCSVEVRQARGSVLVTTSNGRIRVAAEPPEDGEVVLRTSNGSIHADLPAHIRGRLVLHTSNARVHTDMDTVTLRGPRWSRRSFEAEMNGGGPGRIFVRTSNGSITLNCR